MNYLMTQKNIQYPAMETLHNKNIDVKLEFSK